MANTKLVIPTPVALTALSIIGSATTAVAIGSTIGSTAWLSQWIPVSSSVGYTNSYIDINVNNYQNSAYYKDCFGFVHVVIGTKNGTNGTSMFTLPAGYRPSGIVIVPVYYTTVGYVIFNTNGTVVTSPGGASSGGIIGMAHFPGEG
jgi:hypothetical protein